MSNTKTMIVCWAHTQNTLQPSPLTIGGTVLNESDDLHILGVTFESKMTFDMLFAWLLEGLLKDLVS